MTWGIKHCKILKLCRQNVHCSLKSATDNATILHFTILFQYIRRISLCDVFKKWPSTPHSTTNSVSIRSQININLASIRCQFGVKSMSIRPQFGANRVKLDTNRNSIPPGICREAKRFSSLRNAGNGVLGYKLKKFRTRPRAVLSGLQLLKNLAMPLTPLIELIWSSQP